MTGDVPALAACPADKRGRHAIGVIVPPEASMDMTLYCGRCGTLRRVPATGEITVPLDDMAAEVIVRIAGRIAGGSA